MNSTRFRKALHQSAQGIILKDVTREGYTYVEAFSGPKKVGFFRYYVRAGAVVPDDFEGDYGHEGQMEDAIWVDPEYRRQGIATAMIDHAKKVTGLSEVARSDFETPLGEQFFRSLHQSIADTMQFWHGGNLDSGPPKTMGKTRGTASTRFEYGPGLYATTDYSTAVSYAKGSRKLYRLTVRRGQDSRYASIPLEDALQFVTQQVPGPKRKEVAQWLKGLPQEAEGINADSFVNILLNSEAVPASRAPALREFIAGRGIDYTLVPQGRGLMIVIYNMDVVEKVERASELGKIETFDLPRTFEREPLNQSVSSGLMTVYHGTEEPIDSLDFSRGGSQQGNIRGALWFTTSPENAKFYGYEVYEVQLDLKGPVVVDWPQWSREHRGYSISAAVREALTNNPEADAVILKSIIDGAVEADTVCVLDPDCVVSMRHLNAGPLNQAISISAAPPIELVQHYRSGQAWQFSPTNLPWLVYDLKITRNSPGHIDVGFNVSNDTDKEALAEFLGYENFEDMEAGLKGTDTWSTRALDIGDMKTVQECYSAVLAAIEEYSQDEWFDCIDFQADQDLPSRVRFYKRFAQIVKQTFGFEGPIIEYTELGYVWFQVWREEPQEDDYTGETA